MPKKCFAKDTDIRTLDAPRGRPGASSKSSQKPLTQGASPMVPRAFTTKTILLGAPLLVHRAVHVSNKSYPLNSRIVTLDVFFWRHSTVIVLRPKACSPPAANSPPHCDFHHSSALLSLNSPSPHLPRPEQDYKRGMWACKVNLRWEEID